MLHPPESPQISPYLGAYLLLGCFGQVRGSPPKSGIVAENRAKLATVLATV